MKIEEKIDKLTEEVINFILEYKIVRVYGECRSGSVYSPFNSGKNPYKIIIEFEETK